MIVVKTLIFVIILQEVVQVASEGIQGCIQSQIPVTDILGILAGCNLDIRNHLGIPV